MSIASDAPVAHTPSVMRSVSLHRKIRGRCVRSSVSLGAASYGKRRKVSITIRLRRYATSGGGERESRSERSSRGYQEILRVEAGTPARPGRVAFPECFIEQPSAAQILSKAPLMMRELVPVNRQRFSLGKGGKK